MPIESLESVTEIAGLIALGIIITFLVYDRKAQRASTADAHMIWQSWLTSERAARDQASDNRQAALLQQLNSWQNAIDRNEQSRNRDSHAVSVEMHKLGLHIQRMNDLVILVYAQMQSPSVVETMTDIMAERAQAQKET